MPWKVVTGAVKVGKLPFDLIIRILQYIIMIIEIIKNFFDPENRKPPRT